MKNIWWIGPRQSDINDAATLFEGVVTLFGDVRNDNTDKVFCLPQAQRVNHNIINDEQDNFTINNVLDISKNGGRCMFYNANLALKVPVFKDLCTNGSIICVNSPEIMATVNNKIEFRRFIENAVPTLDAKIVSRSDCNYKAIRRLFANNNNPAASFVIQAPIACGGYGTFLLNADNEQVIIDLLDEKGEYIVSEYVDKSIPINIHAIIYDKEIILTAPSIQITRLMHNRLIYRGADYITYRDLNECYQRKFKEYALTTCKKMQEAGYRGICGIDALAFRNEVFILEINNRFQASTPLINKALKMQKMKSLQELCIDAFEHKYPTDYDLKTSNIEIDFSYYTYLQSQTGAIHARLMSERRDSTHIIEILDDGYFSSAGACDDEAYLCRVVFDTNITSITPDHYLAINENIAEHDDETYRLIQKKDPVTSKIALLNQGIYIDESAKKWLEKHGGFLLGTNDALDLFFSSELPKVVNAPISNKFVDLSPFKLVYDRGFRIHYYNLPWKTVNIELADNDANRLTSNGVKFGSICCFATDRVRIHHTNACIFKTNNQGCKFCNIPATSGLLKIEDIKEAVAFYNQKPEVKHFLIGGQSAVPEKEYPLIIETIKAIREIEKNKSIYVMIVPPRNLDIIRQIHEAGATEIAFAIEVFDQHIAQTIMPGKGKIPREHYFEALEYATKYFGKQGAVRSLLVVGVEPQELFLTGIERLAKLHVQPILSVFRPLNDTPMENYTHPSMKYLKEIRTRSIEICRQYGMTLGPDCAFCQNNTLN
ncbi:MAG: radical SAM protein [Clostridia bacterium]|nr:radical SAM protein [Clostridia bacterium]